MRVDLRCVSNMDEDELMLHACLRAEQLLQNLAAVSGKPGLEAITEDQLIQASAMCHYSITQELKGGLINDQAAKAARKGALTVWPACLAARPRPRPMVNKCTAQGGQGVVRPAFMRVVVCWPSERTRSAT